MQVSLKMVKERMSEGLSLKLTQILLDLIDKNRYEGIFEITLVPQTIRIIIDLEIYNNAFEPHFLARSGNYFK